MLNPAKASRPALLEAARSLIGRKNYPKAEVYIIEALRRDINDDAALSGLAELYILQGREKDAVALYMTAIRANPSELSYKERFIEIAGSQSVASYEELVEQTLLACLTETQRLDCAPLQNLWFSHMLHDPAFHSAFQLADRRPFAVENAAFFEGLSNFKPLLKPCFLNGIRRLVVLNPLFDEFLTHVRRHMLDDRERAQKRLAPDERLALAASLSHYCLRTDYIFDCPEAEQQKASALRALVENSAPSPDMAADIALLACYMPLGSLKNAELILQAYSSYPVMTEVVQSQIADWNELRDIATAIEAITEIDDPVSTQVREQYETFPYPRWTTLSPAAILWRWEETGRNKEIAAGISKNKHAQILIAGCGTGREALMLATIFPHASILAVDLSRASLAYAIRKAKEYGVKNLSFKQADILKLNSLGQAFDYIMSGGVLHHMKNPAQGWQVLCNLLKPDGLMTIGLYSKTARKNILEAQEIIRQKGFSSDAAGMRRCRKNAPEVFGLSLLTELARYADYYYLSMFRDLLFHVQEHDYDLPEIRSLLDQLGLSFAGFSIYTSILSAYGARFPDDPLKTNLENWHRFESENPSTFAQMYLFWCKKN